MSTHIALKYHYNTGFGDPNVSARNPKLGYDDCLSRNTSLQKFYLLCYCLKFLSKNLPNKDLSTIWCLMLEQRTNLN